MKTISVLFSAAIFLREAHFEVASLLCLTLRFRTKGSVSKQQSRIVKLSAGKSWWRWNCWCLLLSRWLSKSLIETSVVFVVKGRRSNYCLPRLNSSIHKSFIRAYLVRIWTIPKWWGHSMEPMQTSPIFMLKFLHILSAAITNDNFHVC